MLYQKRKRAAREARIKQLEESPGAWQKLRYKQQKSARNIGFALVVIFVLVPVLFVLLYVRADNLHNEDLPAADENPADASDIFDDQNNPQGDTSVVFDTYDPDDPNQPYDPNEQELPGVPQETPKPVMQIIGTAYLTFDDGPSRTITPGILDILKEEGVVATFFTLPYSGADDLFRRILDEGHELGNHSYSHDYDKLYKGRIGAFRDDVLKARRFIEEHFGYSTTSFRFPGGALNQTREVRTPRIDVINELGYRYFDWQIDTDDWRRGRTSEEIVDEILNNTNEREHVIILMHDTYERTLKALPAIISGLRDQGYEFDILRNHP